MENPRLRADCARCAALCCVAFWFDRSERFGHDKASGEACHHLGEGHQCTIHDRLEGAGYAGCVQYDCLGAGQRVVQDLFGGRSWRDDAALLPPMMAAFEVVRRAHEQLQLLEQARNLPLGEEDRRRLDGLAERLSPDKWTPEKLAAHKASGVAEDVKIFLASLSGLVSS